MNSVSEALDELAKEQGVKLAVHNAEQNAKNKQIKNVAIPTPKVKIKY